MLEWRTWMSWAVKRLGWAANMRLNWGDGWEAAGVDVCAFPWRLGRQHTTQSTNFCIDAILTPRKYRTSPQQQDIPTRTENPSKRVLSLFPAQSRCFRRKLVRCHRFPLPAKTCNAPRGAMRAYDASSQSPSLRIHCSPSAVSCLIHLSPRLIHCLDFYPTITDEPPNTRHG